MVLRVLDAGFGSQLLLSHDAGWFDPAQPGGGTPRGYTHLVTTLIPALNAAGVDDATVDRLTRDNPFAAYADPGRPSCGMHPVADPPTGTSLCGAD